QKACAEHQETPFGGQYRLLLSYSFFRRVSRRKNCFLHASDTITYAAVIPISPNATESGSGTKPSISAPGRYGIANAIPATARVIIPKRLLGMLLQKLPLVLTTRTTASSVRRDSMNQPVWNIC